VAETESVMWGIHAGRSSEADSIFLKDNHIALGWGDMGSLAKLEPTREAFKAEVAKYWPDSKPGNIINSASQLFRFAHEMAVGDLVVYPSKVDRMIHIGKIEGEYQFVHGHEFGNRHKVKWLRHLPRTNFSQGALYEIGSALSLFQVKNYAEEFRAALAGDTRPLPATTDESVALVAEEIEQTARDFIYKQLAQQLKGYGFQAFVANLLTTMGYRTVESPRGTDEGIDIVAHKDELKLEPPIIKVQVKSTEGNVGRPEAQQLFGNLRDGEFGLLITLGTFSHQAHDFARNKSNLRLIDGSELISFVLEHYEQLDPRYKALLPLKRVYIPEAIAEEEEKWSDLQKKKRTATESA